MLRPIPVFPFNVRTNAVGLRSESGRGQVTDHHWPGQDWNDGKKWSAADRVDLALALEGRRTVEVPRTFWAGAARSKMSGKRRTSLV